SSLTLYTLRCSIFPYTTLFRSAPEEMNFFNSFVDKGLLERLNHVANSDFAHVTYTEAIELLEKNNDKFEYKVSWGCDLQTEHERDRKSTRLNSSHVSISYAVFC